MNWPTSMPLVAILRGIKPDEVIDHITVLIEEGFDAIEIPLNSPDWQQSIAIAVDNFSSQVMIGAGTVLNTDDVEQLTNIGAQFIVTPNTDKSVIVTANAAGLYTCIGCMTPSEAFVAIKSGAKALKIFPAGDLGANYIKSLKAVLPSDIDVLAVGGVNADNLAEYMSAGCAGVGLGSDLYKAGQTIAVSRTNAKRYMKAFKNITNYN